MTPAKLCILGDLGVKTISAGLDSSLHVVARLLGPAAAEATAQQMEYEAPAAKGAGDK
ncbi:MAG: hypothetical protein ABSE59_08815 [Opitutaceae bacterium]|jgi:transcriptional regulator GlxA family with amidase domain